MTTRSKHLENDGISAAVGTRASKAQYRLTSTEEVWQLIARLAQTHSQS
jgi:hypothetical protein